MCGIAGFIDFNKKLGYSNLKKMTDILFHRGPDGAGYECYQNSFANIGLGHRRLAIIDLSSQGNQPMTRGDYVVTFNGEIYNYKEIKEELQKLGHQFSGNSDTEVLLNSFIEWGEKAVSRFNGMFSFGILNQKTKKFFLFRDRAGVKPLYYYYENGQFLFSSELKSFMVTDGFSKRISAKGLNTFFQYGYIPTPLSIFENTYKLKQGHYLEIDLKSRNFNETCYWNIEEYLDYPKVKYSEEEILENTESILKSSFNYRMVADVPVGVFLSGGYDSSLVTAILQKDRTEKIDTFTIGFENEKYNEAAHAKKVAQHLGTNHTEYFCKEREAMEIVPNLPEIYDEPFGDSSAIPTTLVSKIASKYVKVVLSADGGDEQFVGYTRHVKALKLASLMNKMGSSSNKVFGNLLKTLNSHGNYHRISNIMKDGRIGSIPLFQTQTLFNKGRRKLLGPNYLDTEIQLPSTKDLNSLFTTEYLQFMQDDILVKVDRATMASSIEGREPFLDYRIAEWSMQLPVESKYKENTLKYLLKKITHKYIPKSIMERPKQGFGVPIHDWLRGDLSDIYNEFLGDNSLKMHGLFDSSFVRDQKLKYINKHKLSNPSFIWNLIVFQMWYNKWLK